MLSYHLLKKMYKIVLDDTANKQYYIAVDDIGKLVMLSERTWGLIDSKFFTNVRICSTIEGMAYGLMLSGAAYAIYKKRKQKNDEK